MNEKWQITKKELKTRAQDVAGGYFNDHMMQAAVATARALGYEVVEEPELPEQLYVGRSMRGEPPATSLLWVKRGEDTWPVLAHFEMSNTPPGFEEELVRRWDAKATVLAQLSLIEQEVDQFAVHWPRPDLGTMIARVRAAYEKEKS